MDEHNENDATVLIGRFDDGIEFSVDGRRFAFLGFSDESLSAELAAQGAEVCETHDPHIDIVVADVSVVSADLLREKLSEQSIAKLQQGLVQILSPAQLRICLDQSGPLVHGEVTRAMLADMLKVSVLTVRSWQRRGLIQPMRTVNKLDYFDFQEVVAARQIATLVELGIKPATIQKNLAQLARWMPAQDSASTADDDSKLRSGLARLSVQVDGSQLLLRQGNTLFEAGGQKRLNFGVVDEVDAKASQANTDRNHHILPFEPAQRTSGEFTSPRDLLEAAEEMEDSGQLSQAAEVYRSLMLAYGPDAEICLRMGELLFRMGDLSAARERYSMAIEIDESLVEARAALGCVLGELDQSELAISALEGALKFHPNYSDVHFQLARLLQNAGDEVQALRHWQRFVELSPAGPWAEEARSQIGFLQGKLTPSG